MGSELAIRGGAIRLGQLLKLAGWIETGGEARGFLAAHEVRVNGEPETRRGRQLRAGDEVACAAEVLRLTELGPS